MSYRVREWVHSRGTPIRHRTIGRSSGDAFDESAAYLRQTHPDVYARVDDIVRGREWHDCESETCDGGFWRSNAQRRWCSDACRVTQKWRDYHRRAG